MELTREQLQIIADKSNELDLGQLDKYILNDATCCDVFNNISSLEVITALDKAYKDIMPTKDIGSLGRNEARTWSVIMETALKYILENPRTKTQKEIDSWIADNIHTDALDRFIKIRLSDYPGFKRFDSCAVFNAIEDAYCDIEPEQDYDPYIWTAIVEEALNTLEPDRDKLFKIKFNNYEGYIKEMIVGHEWLSCNTDRIIEKECLRLALDEYINRAVILEDEDISCTIVRIK